jgi:hypothetical protein
MMGKATKKATKTLPNPKKLQKDDYFGFLKEKRGRLVWLCVWLC